MVKKVVFSLLTRNYCLQCVCLFIGFRGNPYTKNTIKCKIIYCSGCQVLSARFSHSEPTGEPTGERVGISRILERLERE